jgi:hypothetical protein
MEMGQRVIEGFLGTGKRERSPSEPPSPFDADSDPGPSRLSGDTWTCPRCREVIQAAIALERMKQEHEDFHLAMDLSQAVEPPVKRAKKKETGIRAFFTPKW